MAQAYQQINLSFQKLQLLPVLIPPEYYRLQFLLFPAQQHHQVIRFWSLDRKEDILQFGSPYRMQNWVLMRKDLFLVIYYREALQ